MKHNRYKPVHPITLKDRTWPDQRIETAPIWCSVDLRDGNQALETPMSLHEKLDYFKTLLKIGFKEIEVGFPAASDTEFEFARTLIDKNLIPDDVTIQVLTQSRDHIIDKTFEAVAGAKNAIIHLYNSTSTLQRDVVFGNDKQATIDLAVSGAKRIIEKAKQYPETNFTFQYSPESFTGTEVDFAVEICNAVLAVFQPSKEKKAIINLPSTVEMFTPNVYADMIEYCCRNIKNRENVIISLHTHNDRGTGIAASELGLMAGADRIEGTLFGNGERTGNADIMNLALNMFSQGVDPVLDFSQINDVVDFYEKYTHLAIHPRHPYAGDLVYTAFSGSHQDAINKGMKRMEEHPDHWEVPYLPIDPLDVGRSYDPIIRINSQSGKGGVAYVLEMNYGIRMPKAMQQAFSLMVTKESDIKHSDLTPQEIYNLFENKFINVRAPLELQKFQEYVEGKDVSVVKAHIVYQGVQKEIEGRGPGIMSAFCNALESFLGFHVEVIHYNEHSMEYGTKSKAITYIQMMNGEEVHYFGAGVSSSISKSSLRAIVSAVNHKLAFIHKETKEEQSAIS